MDNFDYKKYLAEGRLLKEYETSKWYVIYRLRDPENDVNKYNINEKPPHDWETISGVSWDSDKYGEGRDRAKARAAAYTRGDEKLEDFQLALDAEANRIPQEGDNYQFNTDRKEESWSMEESVNEYGGVDYNPDSYRRGTTPSDKQFNRFHTNNKLAKIFSHKKRKLTPDEFKTLTDSLGIKLVDNPLPLTDRDEAPDPWMKDDVARGTRYKKSYIKVYDDKYKEIDKENDEKIFLWIRNLDDYEIKRKITQLK